MLLANTYLLTYFENKTKSLLEISKNKQKNPLLQSFKFNACIKA